MNDLTEGPQWNDDAIRTQLDRILGHPEFHATEKMREFLRFIVEETLAGNARSLKGFTIATEVFGRDEEFDPAHDPVVRIQAGRLRRAVERYYLVAGRNDPIYIDIPKGGYVPVFSEAPAAGAPGGATQAPRRRDRVASWPSILVIPFEDQTGREDLSFLSSGLATELGIELASTGDLRVMLFSEALSRVRVGESRPDFEVRGSIRAEDSTIKVVIQLVGAKSGELLWTDSVKAELEDGRIIDFQEETAAAIAAQVAGEHGAIFRAVTDAATRQSVSYRGNFGAILKGYTYHQSFDPESYLRAFHALSEARCRDADCGLVCSMLALMYVDNLTLEFFDVARTPLPEALSLARNGVRIEPRNQMSRIALARALMLNDELPDALKEVRTARALQPHSVLFTDAIGYLLVLLGDWDRGERLIRKTIELNPFHRVFVRYATWLNCFRQQDYAGAMEETQWLGGVGYFWDPLCRAVTLSELGRFDEARAAVRELLDLKPDFQERGVLLIRHLIKFPELEDRIVNSLARAGLALGVSQGQQA